MNIAAILAGGSGLRMGTAVPKQFLEIEGVPVIIRSINAFLSSGRIDKCIVSVSEDFVSYTEELICKHVSTATEIFVIKGGKTRGDTLFGVLAFMKEKGFLEGSVVLTHDAVRPFINDRIIEENIAAAEKYGACNTAIPAVDTMLLSADGKFIDSVPDRSRLFHAQTPQSFDAQRLYSLIENTPRDVFELMTDGCSVFTYHGEKVFLVKGETFNIKITYPDDLIRAKGIIREYFN
ncbi:MAG: 2-C-methyl-D-erythritol 4-phosphate cytidylyltransferase [Clostridia bacterium]|nr:2-C-methyl-D-erythritol 4-phosphate cytidylyltransferase [Clostridia bacterium]